MNQFHHENGFKILIFPYFDVVAVLALCYQTPAFVFSSYFHFPHVFGDVGDVAVAVDELAADVLSHSLLYNLEANATNYFAIE